MRVVHNSLESTIEISNAGDGYWYIAVNGYGEVGTIIRSGYKRGDYRLHSVSSYFTMGNFWSFVQSTTIEEGLKALLATDWEVYAFDNPLDFAKKLVELLEANQKTTT